MDLNNKTAIVTGAIKGIGKTISIALAKKSADAVPHLNPLNMSPKFISA